MVADNWLKRNPFVGRLLFSAITIIGALIVVKAEWVRNDKIELRNAIEKKADKTYVDQENTKQDFYIEKKADKSLVESMDKKLDLILQKLK